MADAIFISYRRQDSISNAGRLHDRLVQAFGRKNIFMDVDHIPAGVDFVSHLNRQVAACRVFLVVIGPHWLNANDAAGQSRLQQPDDFVAIEIAAALARDIRVIPVLVDGAGMPAASELPDRLKSLARRQAVEIRQLHFGRDSDALIARIREALGRSAGLGRWQKGSLAGTAAAMLLAAGWMALSSMSPPQTALTVSPPVAGPMSAAAVLREAEAAAQRQRAALEAEAEAARKKQEAEQQRLAALKAEEERSARAAADAEAARKKQEAEQQWAAALKAEDERKARVAAEAEAARKKQEAEQQRLAALKAEDERRARIAAEAEAARKKQEAEQQWYAALKAEEDRRTKAEAEVARQKQEAARRKEEAEQQWFAALKAEEERQARAAKQNERQPPAPGPVSPAPASPAQYSISWGVAVKGDDYRRLSDMSIDRCATACMGDTRCRMFSYWGERVCYLFDKSFDTFPHNSSQVGYPNRDPLRSSPALPTSAGDGGFSIVREAAVTGDDYKRFDNTTIDRCASACGQDTRCRMFAHWKNNVCYLFDQRFSTHPNGAAQVGYPRSRTSAQ